MAKIKKIWKALQDAAGFRSDGPAAGQAEFFGSVFFVLISAVLTALNVVKAAAPSMTAGTSFLIVGFAVSAYLAHRRLLTAAKWMIIVLCGAIFTMFAISGGNDGFAILWILLVPMIGPLWLGLRFGVILSSYFMVLVIVLFDTPLSELVRDYYTPTFMLRFPLLYFASFGSGTYLMWQHEALTGKLYRESYFDALTGLRNRRSYSEFSAKFAGKPLPPRFTYVSFDLNRLKYTNDTFGHQAGDELIRAASEVIRKNFPGAQCFRTGGDEFVAAATDIDMEKALAGLKKDCAAWQSGQIRELSISVGYAEADSEPGIRFRELAMLADKKMYEDKARYHDACRTGQ